MYDMWDLRVRETAVGSAVLNITVLAARAPWNHRAAHLLDGTDTSESLQEVGLSQTCALHALAGTRTHPEVRVSNLRELFLDGLEESTGLVEASIGTAVERKMRYVSSLLSEVRSLRVLKTYWLASGAKRIVAPLDPPLPVSLS